jgi:hypothetical protein
MILVNMGRCKTSGMSPDWQVIPSENGFLGLQYLFRQYTALGKAESSCYELYNTFTESKQS